MQHDRLDQFMKGLRRRNPGETEFHQAVEEFAQTVMPYLGEHPIYHKHRVLERMTEPDRIIIFRVSWMDDDSNVRVNRGCRVQFNNTIGPYKGGLRFHPNVNLSILKFLGFEQTFKNSLTTLPMGGAKGGANFNPKGKSDGEVMRFCHSFMIELAKHIGKDCDVPAGDIGVGAREVGYLFGHYKRLQNEFTGVITGKGLEYGGSLIRKEATGYGCAYFVQHMLERAGSGLAGKTCAVSGSGNVALYTIEQCLNQGATVVTVSDSSGFIHDPDGVDAEKLAWLKDLKEVRRGRVSEYAETFGVSFHPDARPWSVPCDVAFPSATQNEIEIDDARTLIANGLEAVGEGANMPSTLAAAHAFVDAGVLYAPSKAANAGGVAVSGLEQSQNSLRMSWTRDEVDTKLREVMSSIHEKCVQYGENDDGSISYVRGANIAGFVKVADAMIAQGVV
jgi:glutamate dehydrogenase (NADP+)